ncbi:DNA-binding transcriptional LysR family regulator [Anaerobacterium chartisolvens]|uniref:DNA-binding transcriptional LysR family regulator n=1 Tax=Anaerobacterium chartisolvens TaxID=1297424 RepID=A0A369BHR5_9FIRM|nr:LysR family transcriptional regulator [Anaerobacterium chartisolvens]RCX20951.1 DNA-binding transcriptional LysR family regulator [Anaerobacterium chartisolvens]
MIDSKLITFINVARLGSFTRAAEMLNLTQPAVTQHIKQIEEFYRVKLIRKKGKQLSLTEEGELLLQYAKNSNANAMLLERRLKNKGSMIKRYNIGATLTIGEFVLPHLLGKHKRLYNNIDIIMQVNNSEDIVNKLISGEIDLGIVEGPFDKSRFNHIKLKDDELVLVAAPLSSFVKRPGVEMHDIIHSGKLILREKGSGTRVIFENKLVEMGYKPSDVKTYMEVGSIGAIKSLVEANLGYTIISKEAVSKEVEAETLVIIPIHHVRIMREFNFIYLHHAPMDFIKGFIDFIMGD